jgi:hypothetical protein
VIASQFGGGDDKPAPETTAAVVAKPQPSAEEQARELRFQGDVLRVRALRQAMKNPASFQLESAVRMKDGTLCLSYRATNSFNAIVPGQAVLSEKASATSGQKGFASQWNRLCANKTGVDLTYIRRAL